MVPKSSTRAPGTALDPIFNRFWTALGLVLVGFDITKSKTSTAFFVKLLFAALLDKLAWKSMKNKNAQLQSSRRKGTVAGSARSALGYKYALHHRDIKLTIH